MTDSSLALCMRLARCYTSLTRRLDGRLSSLHGLSFGDFMVMHYLHHAEGSRLRRIDLAERMGLTASAVTRILLPLEKIGLIARQPDPRDARVGYAALTETGRRVFTEASVTAATLCQDITRSMPVEQVSALSGVLAQLAGIHPSAD